MDNDILEILAKAYKKKGYLLDKEDAKLKLATLKLEKMPKPTLDEIIENKLNESLRIKGYSICKEDAERILEDIDRDIATAIQSGGSSQVQQYKEEFEKLEEKGNLLFDTSNVFFVYKQYLKMEPPQWYVIKYGQYKC